MRIAIIGFGQRASLYREAVARGAVVVAVVEPDPARAAAAAAELPDAVVTADLGEALALGPDAVMLFTPDDAHAAPAIAALRAGAAVFAEKPLAITTEDADAVLEAARESGSRLYVGHNMRHMPVVTLMKRLLDEGRIGAVKAIWCRHFVGHGGDYYFKDWHADAARTTGLLLQKGAHDLDVIHWLAGGYTRRVTGMGGLTLYGDIADRRDRSGERMGDWFSLDNWPPATLTGLNPVVDVEDLSMVSMRLDNGVLASYEQCHYTPDYWRNYTVIGTEGRIENVGDGPGERVALWNRRTRGWSEPDEWFEIAGGEGGHGGADGALVAEFLRFAADGGSTDTSPVAAREAVATGVAATLSIRADSRPLDVPPLPADLVAYFERGQREE